MMLRHSNWELSDKVLEYLSQLHKNATLSVNCENLYNSLRDMEIRRAKHCDMSDDQARLNNNHLKNKLSYVDISRYEQIWLDMTNNYLQILPDMSRYDQI